MKYFLSLLLSCSTLLGSTTTSFQNAHLTSFHMAKSNYRLDRWEIPGEYYLYFDLRTFVGSDDVAILAASNGLHAVYQGTLRYMEMTNDTPCGATCLHFDPATRKLGALFDGCFFGPGGPYKLNFYQCDANFTNAVYLSTEDIGDVDSFQPDFIGLTNGGFVFASKSFNPAHNYEFHYRKPDATWQSGVFITNVVQFSGSIKMVQNADGSIWAFLMRDGHHNIPVVHFIISGGTFTNDWTANDDSDPNYFLKQYGEIADNNTVFDTNTGKLLYFRQTDPGGLFSVSPFRNGCSVTVSLIGLATNDIANYVYPTPPNSALWSEDEDSHGFCQSYTNFWMFRQLYNASALAFDRVYATPFDLVSKTFGEPVFLYRAVDDTHWSRDGAHNYLTDFYNFGATKTKIRFASRYTDDSLNIFELVPTP